jgi:conjugal transfer pilus assembly protein TraF
MRIMLRMLLGAMLQAAAADAAEPPAPSYYSDQERGWYWRETPPTPAIVRRPKPPPPGSGAGAPREDVPLTAAWFRKHLDSYRDLALDDPTPENVERYQLLQRYAMDKADRFATVWEGVVRDNPALDETNERPLTAMQKRAVNSVVSKARESLLDRLGQTLGIWYFFRSDCPYCHRQNEAIETLIYKHDFSVLPISLDGQPMSDGAFPNFATNDSHAQRLGVTVTPTLFLVKPPAKLERLAVGLKTVDDLEDLILDTAKRAGWITEQEYTEATHGVAPTYLVDRLSGDQLANDPDQLLIALRRAAAGIGGSSPWQSESR